MAYRLDGRVVLVTGASSGIGRACVEAYHRAGCRVAAVARSAEKLRVLADSLGDGVAAVPADITEAAGRDAAVRETRERLGPIDVLVNNAGWASFASVLRTPVEHVRRMVDLNFVAPVAMIQAVLGEMLSRGSGQIVNISSVVGAAPMPRMEVYCATKSALNTLGDGLRMELTGTGVDVITVAPGSTNTSFFSAAATVDAKAERVAQTQYSPERVARAVVRASRRRRRQVTLTGEGKAITAIRRVSHRLADGIMYRVARKSMPKLSD